MKNRTRIGLGVLALAATAGNLLAAATGVTPDEIAKITAALPAKATAKPQKPRKVLLLTLTKGFYHDSIPVAAKTFELLGEKTGAFETVVTNDITMLAPEKLRAFDAVIMNNNTGDLFAGQPKAAELKQSLLDFVAGGKGIMGVHAATDCCYNWKEYGDMMGGYFQGHPFSKIVVKNDDPKSPINAAFNGEGFNITDEMYTFKAPYSRTSLRILLSIDMEKTKLEDDPNKPGFKKGENRNDHDYAISWIRPYGKGRVFYCSFGHQHDIFWKTPILQHYLDGLQYALGDLPADAAPSVKP
jgi:type 1 glutamine amidotransferase